MEHSISRVVVQRICDEQSELVPYLTRIIDSLERHGGLYHEALGEFIPDSVIEEIEYWLTRHLDYAGEELRSEVLRPDGIGADLRHLGAHLPRARGRCASTALTGSGQAQRRTSPG